MPPETSPVNNMNKTVLQHVEEIMVNLGLANLEIIMNEDFNSRTSDNSHFNKFEPKIPKLADLSDIVGGDTGIKRETQDKVANKYGRELLSFCKTFFGHIANGLFGNTPESSGYTFITRNGCSTTDYFIVTKTIFKLITLFQILPREESSHLPISVLKLIPIIILILSQKEYSMMSMGINSAKQTQTFMYIFITMYCHSIELKFCDH